MRDHLVYAIPLYRSRGRDLFQFSTHLESGRTRTQVHISVYTESRVHTSTHCTAYPETVTHKPTYVYIDTDSHSHHTRPQLVCMPAHVALHAHTQSYVVTHSTRSPTLITHHPFTHLSAHSHVLRHPRSLTLTLTCTTLLLQKEMS